MLMVMACVACGEREREPSRRDAQARAPLRGQNAATADALGVTAIAQAAPQGFGLDGSGVRVGVWDEAHARDSHVDLRGRVTLRDVGGFGEHATHTTGTLAGTGTGDASARGMAPAARVWAYDWLLDLAELEQAAPALSVSSHAYGPTLGWSLEDACPAYSTWRGAATAREDAAFGRYAQSAALLDALVLRTDLLTVWPAGNERADTGPAQGEPHYHLGSCSDLFTDPHLNERTLQHDTLAGLGVAKNVLTVGAISAASADALRTGRVVPLEVSGFGPTDDGRIKPDLVASGDRVHSTSAVDDAAYSTATGTSSATAAVAGASALLVQLYRQLHEGSDPRADALKALLVHPARDVGELGPDVATGYGLLDAQAAAELLASDADAAPGAAHVLVTSIAAGETLTLQAATPVDEDTAVRVTLAWTDPPAEPARGALDDRTKALVDDLDLRVVTPDGQPWSPWSLDDSARAQARSGEPNRTDNLEVVDARVRSPGPGKLQVIVQAPSELRRDAARSFALVSSVPLVPPEQPVLQMPRYVEATRPAGEARVTLHAQLGSRYGGAVSFTARALEPWLAVTPAQGEAPIELSIELDLDALGAARHVLGHISIESDEAGGERVLGVLLRDGCEPECSAIDCGPDPRCGVICARCAPDQRCERGRCTPLADSCPHADLGSELGAALVASKPAAPSDTAGSCGGDAGGERAFAWRAPHTGRYAFTTRGSSSDTVLYARSEGCDGEELACNDDSGGLGSAFGLTLEAGEPLTLFVDGFEDGPRAPVALGVEALTCPSVSLGSRTGLGVAVAATEGGLDLLSGSCGGVGSEEARFAWTAPYAGSFRFALFDPAYQSVLYVRDGDCEGDELDCSFATDVGPVEVALDADQQVAVIVDGREGRSGPFTLDILDRAASCEGTCGSSDQSARCACDAACVAAGDCCADACELCGACRCERSCQGRRCGPDGCGGECGACGPGLACDDGACVPDACEGVSCAACERCEGGRCVALPEASACEDGDPCTLLDACQDGRCVGVARDCDDGRACTVDRCDDATGLCASRAGPDCCDAGTGCEAMALGDAGAPAKPERRHDGCGCRLGAAPDTGANALGSWLGIVASVYVCRFRRRRCAFQRVALSATPLSECDKHALEIGLAKAPRATLM